MKNLEATVSELLALYKGKDKPLLIFGMPLNDDNLLFAKKLMVSNQADVLLLGNEVEIALKCNKLRINDDMFYGVLNPKDHNDREAWILEIMKQNPELLRKDAIVKAESTAYVLTQLLQLHPKAHIIQ